MTQVAVGTGEVLAPVPSTASVAIPLPRRPEAPAPLAEPSAAAEAPRRHPLPARTRSARVVVAADLLVTTVAATVATATGLLPVEPAAATAAGWLVALAAAGHYRRRMLGESTARRSGLVLRTAAQATLLALAAVPFVGALAEVGAPMLVLVIAVLCLATTVPVLLGVGHRVQRVVLLGRARDVRDASVELRASRRHEVVAACLVRASKLRLDDIETYVGLADTADVVRAHEADAVVVLPGARLTPHEVRRLHWSLAATGAELYLGTGLLDVDSQRTRVVSSAGLDVLHVSHPVLGGPARLLKDVVERGLALLALLVALPVLAVLCVAIRLETPGPALFRQERIGRDGVPFTMLKLRSMGVEAEAERTGLLNEKDGVLFKIRRDPRITPLGRVLRRYSLDELPQLWNVVRGDMSLGGPRPALPGEVARYDIDPRRRLVVKPGLTGLWQVSGRSDLTWEESVRLDLRYVENWSLGLDLRILGRTAQAVVGHRGAY